MTWYYSIWQKWYAHSTFIIVYSIMLLFFQPLTATMQQEGFINLVMHASEHITTQNLSSVSSA